MTIEKPRAKPQSRALSQSEPWESVRIVISAEPRLLHIMREVVRYYARDVGFPESEVYRLVLAVDEAATSAIRHTYGSRPNGRLALEVRNLHDRLEFVIEDTGPKVRSDAIRPRALDDVRPGGLGSFFIKSFTDSSSCDEAFTEGNRLRLVKFKRPCDECVCHD
jgi:anti-sigma regulatory factor (Ser/Thr protein kinase)